MTVARTPWPLVGRDDEMTTLASALDGPVTGVVIAGPAGVGRTRLAWEAGELARHLGRPVHRAAASAAAAAVPLGALAHLLPGAPTAAADPELLRHAVSTLGAGPARPVLVVDDAHLLDPLTVTLLHLIAAGGTATLVATVPGAGPDPMADLWKDDHAVRLDVAPLSRAHTDGLLGEVLPGHVDSRVVEQLWRLSQGNARVLREFVEGGRESGRLHTVDGLWRWSGPMEPTSRLTGIVLTQLAGLGATERAALDVLAVAGPLPVQRFVELVGRDTVAALERAGLVRVDRPGAALGTAQARPVNPVHAVVLAAQLPAADAGRIRRHVVGDPLNPSVGSADELLRAGRMLLDGETADVDAGVLAGAAEEAAARADHPLAERLARAALSAGGGDRARAALVEALQWQGRAADAEQVAAATGVSARMLSVRALNLQLGLRRPDEARRVLEDAAPRDRTGVLPATQALLALRSGDIGRAIELGERVLSSTDAVAGHPLAAAAAAAALAVQGRAAEALAAVAAGRDAGGGGPAMGELALEQARLVALLHSGRIAEFAAAAAAMHRSSLAGAESARDAIGALHRGGAALAGGRMDQAARWLTEALSGLDRRDPLDLRPVCVAWLATARALLGDTGSAAELLGTLDAGGSLFAPQTQRARVWVAASEGRVDEAAALALHGAHEAGAAGQPVVQAGLLHDAVRLGRAADAAHPLSVLAGSAGAPLVSAAADHAEALAGDDGSRLDTVSVRFEELGALLLAADAAAQSATVHLRAGDRRRSAAAAVRSTLLARECGNPRTPALVGLERPELTTRERDVARLAADGLSNQVIARRLVVSIRTVETHLAHAYTKLGIGSRGELEGALGPRR